MSTIFAPHGMCMMWNPRLIWLHVVTDGLVALSYYSIPAALFALTFKKRDAIPVRPLVILFGLFIAFCGAGHAMDIVSIWKPIYWVKGFWNIGTALTSVVTAFVLIPQVAGFLRLPEKAARLEREKLDIQERHGILRAVLNSVSEGILLTDQHGQVVNFNPASETILGTTPDGAVPHWPGGNGETRIGGRIVEHTEHDAGPLGRVHVLRDVTEKRHSEALRLRLEHVIATMTKGFAIVSVQSGLIENTNASMEQMFGGPLSGTPVQDIFAGADSEKRATFEAIRDAAQAEPFWEGETLCQRRDGSLFPVITRANLHNEDDGPILSLLQTDISAQKRMQAETEQLQAKLQQAQKLESLGVLAGGVAHDFNNLLTGIMGNASLALYSAPNDEVRDRLQDVIIASERAADLTRQLLAYAGKGHFLAQPLDISQLLRETAKLLRSTIPGNVEIQFDLAPNLPLVHGDSGRIQPILMNLAINAFEAIGDQAGVVELIASQRQVSAEDGEVNQLGEALVPGTYICITVRDNGCGMSDETRLQIFDPFFTTKFTGRGLGLSAVAGVVRSHGGNIKVTSALGRGSTFQILLPALQAAPPQAAVPFAKFDLRGSGTVLVVDDDEVVRRTAAVALQHYGYEVQQAENGKLALELLARIGPTVSLVLLDTTMPVMSGAETLVEIQKSLPHIPIILTSGFSQHEAMRRFEGAGLAGFLEKPFTAQTLAELVKSVIRR